jgi:hypothetical protein
MVCSFNSAILDRSGQIWINISRVSMEVMALCQKNMQKVLSEGKQHLEKDSESTPSQAFESTALGSTSASSIIAIVVPMLELLNRMVEFCNTLEIIAPPFTQEVKGIAEHNGEFILSIAHNYLQSCLSYNHPLLISCSKFLLNTILHSVHNVYNGLIRRSRLLNDCDDFLQQMNQQPLILKLDEALSHDDHSNGFLCQLLLKTFSNVAQTCMSNFPLVIDELLS